MLYAPYIHIGQTAVFIIFKKIKLENFWIGIKKIWFNS